MNDAMTLVISAIAGLVLGTIFFGGLWWTVRSAMTSPRPALWFFCSLILRMGIVLVGIYYVGAGDWRRMIACLGGFMVARIVVILLTRQTPDIRKEAGDAP